MAELATTIRDAALSDLPALLEIYNEVVRNSNAIWTEEPRTPEQLRAWFEERVGAGFPVLVALRDARIVSYATFGPFRAWPGYRLTVENSIYVRPDARGRGVGRVLLSALITRAQAHGVHVMIAGIDGENHASVRLHESLGYVQAAHLHEVGIKHGRWLDLLLLEKRLDTPS